VGAGSSAANLYYAQPLAAEMARSLAVPVAALGSALTATQLGYAFGMIMLVPIGDGRERRSVILATIACAVPALFLLASASSVALLVASSFLVGMCSSVAQMIVPYAVELAPVEDRGKVVGTVMAGLLTGILLSRTASGAIGSALGWRAVYLVAGALMVALGVVLRLVLPERQPARRIPYLEIQRSLLLVLRTQPVLRRRALTGALGFASFSIFWSMLSFHLATLGHGSASAGLFGVVGVIGVAVAPIAGRLATGPRPARLNFLALTATALSFAVFALAGRSLGLLAAGVVLLDAGVQASQLTNQTVIYGLQPELRGRINALYMVIYFAGGAFGTVSATAAWSLGGWHAVCATGASTAVLAMVPLFVELRGDGRGSARG